MATEDDELEEALDDELDDFDDFDDDEDDEDEGGLSGLVVLLMGIVMLGAFVSVVWIAYQQGIKNKENLPYVAADPEPVKIETVDAGDAADGNEREVYDNLEGREDDPIEVIAESPEEPVSRDVDDTIGAIASAVEEATEITDDAVADRIAELEKADGALGDLASDGAERVGEIVDDATDRAGDVVADATDAVADAAENVAAPSLSVPDPASAPTVSTGDALSGTHLVQVGAFRSDAEAQTYWNRMESSVGDYLNSKSQDVERADLGAKGVYYRLRIGPFASADAARTYCTGLKDRGQDCLIKAK